MPTVLITPEEMLHKVTPAVEILRAAGFEIQYPIHPKFTWGHTSEEETVAQMSECDAVISGAERLTRGVLSQLPRMRVIARCGVGFDRVDVAAATELGMPITITPTANFGSVAEQTFALMLAVAKLVVPHDRSVREGWSRTVTQPLRGRTLGLFGLGRIGRAVAVRGRPFEMGVLATETYPDFDFVAQHQIDVDFDRLLAQSDYLSIHCPLTGETQGLFNKDAFAKMKPASVLINTARGGVVVEADLADALKSGQLSGAGLDVLEQEPTPLDNPLLKLDNVVLSPHVAGEDVTSLECMGTEAAESIIRLHRGEWPEGCVVNDELRVGWSW